jgi:phosphomannomutase
VVSGSLLRRLAQAAGVRCVTTLTGFKWIARAGGADDTLIYGYEQATGYAVRPDLVADKDGISAALLVLQLATEEAQRDRTLLDRLDDIALAHGLHVTGQRVLHADGPTGLAQLADAVARVRKEPPRLLAGQPVTVTDLQEGRSGSRGPGRRPRRARARPADPGGGRPDLARGASARVMIRPSGTEPELKIYAEAARPVRSRAELAAARASAAEQVEQMLAAAAGALEPGPLEPNTKGDRS